MCSREERDAGGKCHDRGIPAPPLDPQEWALGPPSQLGYLDKLVLGKLPPSTHAAIIKAASASQGAESATAGRGAGRGQ